ncbi:unnamed protein product [Nesidiocoris tenuis]|uniref:Uncharacterized protein n=1 Tax=Nesidiocoris tenuis TaxID=355587 RepID=A0A6H5FVV0_9HEMI|nr:unnamed protein product [Nesidiocoris tenuis]
MDLSLPFQRTPKTRLIFVTSSRLPGREDTRQDEGAGILAIDQGLCTGSQ